MQVLPLDPMCKSVNTGVTQALTQHLASKELSDFAAMQFGGQSMRAAASAEADTDAFKPVQGNMKVKRSVSFDPSAPDLLARGSAESDDDIEPSLTNRFGGSLKDRHTRRVYSLPVENQMSTQDLLSAEQRRASSSEIRLTVRP